MRGRCATSSGVARYALAACDVCSSGSAGVCRKDWMAAVVGRRQVLRRPEMGRLDPCIVHDTPRYATISHNLPQSPTIFRIR